jgi:hypothetical protein
LQSVYLMFTNALKARGCLALFPFLSAIGIPPKTVAI